MSERAAPGPPPATADARAPGVAPDGSPVAVYDAAPLEPEFTPVLDLLEPPASVLDLGCGTGRLADALAARGFAVTGVDESAEMLAHVSAEVDTVQAPIQVLVLPGRFDAVVLASLLVNEADPDLRAALLGAARGHVAADGVVLIEHRDPTSPVYRPGSGRWTSELPARGGALEITLETLDRDGDHITARSEYRLGDTTWVQPFEAVLLDDAGLAGVLADAGLAVERRLDPRWLLAVPTG